MSEKPGEVFLISVIIPTYNAEKYIEACIHSILNITFSAIQVVIMDGGSTDETLQILARFKDHPVKIVSGKDQGLYDAMNKGIDLASGKWFYFMGADDRLLNGFSELAGKLEDDDTIYYANSVPFYEDEQLATDYGLLQGEFSPYRLAKYCMNHQSILYPSKVFKTYSYETRYSLSADYALNICLWGDDRFKKQFYNIEIVSYNMGGRSSFNKDHLFDLEKHDLIRKYMGWGIFLRYMIRSYKDRWKRKTG